MALQSGADRFSVYLGSGIYVGGIVHAKNENSDASRQVPVLGCVDGPAIKFDFVDGAALYMRDAAVRVCHVARRSGVRAWIVKSPVVAS